MRQAIRSPMARAKSVCALAERHPVDLLTRVLQQRVERNRLDPGQVDDVICGCVSQAGEQAGTPGRLAWLAAGLPAHVQAELSQLFGLLATAAGRRGIVGLSPSWEDATVAESSAALQSMRASGTELRIQAYQGLHDIVFVPYFSGEESWKTIGYPGPRAV